MNIRKAMTLTKAEIAANLHCKIGFNKRESKMLVDCFFEEIRRSLESNTEVKLSNFGNFELRDKCARPGRNPRTGEEIIIKPRRVVTFKPGPKLKERISSPENATC